MKNIMETYLTRLIDEKVERYLSSFGAVSIVGPGWSEKTSTALHHAQSAFYLTPTPEIPEPLVLESLILLSSSREIIPDL